MVFWEGQKLFIKNQRKKREVETNMLRASANEVIKETKAGTESMWIGMQVEVEWLCEDGRKEWYEGKVTGFHANHTYSVQYEDESSYKHSFIGGSAWRAVPGQIPPQTHTSSHLSDPSPSLNPPLPRQSSITNFFQFSSLAQAEDTRESPSTPTKKRSLITTFFHPVPQAQIRNKKQKVSSSSSPNRHPNQHDEQEQQRVLRDSLARDPNKYYYHFSSPLPPPSLNLNNSALPSRLMYASTPMSTPNKSNPPHHKAHKAHKAHKGSISPSPVVTPEVPVAPVSCGSSETSSSSSELKHSEERSELEPIFTSEEQARFLYCLRFHPPQGQWGLFSMNMPGRTGADCARYFHRLSTSSQHRHLVAFALPMTEDVCAGDGYDVGLTDVTGTTGSVEARDQGGFDSSNEDDDYEYLPYDTSRLASTRTMHRNRHVSRTDDHQPPPDNSTNLDNSCTCRYSGCELVFVSPEALMTHVRSQHRHTSRRKLTCGYCGYIGRTKSAKTVHMRTHTGERPFECKKCESAFRSKSHLSRHMRTHSDKKPHACTQCEYTCRRPDNLRAHIKQVHKFA